MTPHSRYLAAERQYQAAILKGSTDDMRRTRAAADVAFQAWVRS